MDVASRHLVLKADQANYEVPEVYRDRSEGFRRWEIVGEKTPGAVHTGFSVCELEPGGWVARHVHSYEESFYVIEGEGVCETPEGVFAVRPGDYGVIPVGVEHRWRNDGSTPVRWAEMLAPQPRAAHGEDSYFVADVVSEAPPLAVDVRDPRTRSFGHIDPENMDVDKQTQDRLAVSASMRTALLVYSGITVKMMVDTDLGSQLLTMFMVQYQPGGFAGPHDHPLEETYLFLEGEAEGVFDGHRYRLEPGDVAFAGVGCIHEFSNAGDGIVRWLETQAPQPPARHSYRFVRDWRYLQDKLT
jgi:quercetin dioxygenase-like cupin family protein